MARTIRIEVYEDKKHAWRYRRIAANGEITSVAGQGYASRGGARRAAKRDNPNVRVVSV